jgi:hypothetical protein
VIWPCPSFQAVPQLPIYVAQLCLVASPSRGYNPLRQLPVHRVELQLAISYLKVGYLEDVPSCLGWRLICRNFMDETN